jgi:Uma2 family endonuclease
VNTFVTLAEIRQALSLLSAADRAAIARWLENSTERIYGGYKVEEPRAVYAERPPTYMTREEFLEFQEQSPVADEYVNGIIRALSGPSVAHGLVTQNIFRAVDSHLRGSPCQSFCTGVRLNLTLGDDRIIYEPDLYVSCDRSAWDKKWIPNPRFVVEVLSPSSQHIDRREKSVNYRRVPTLDEYVLAAQTRPELTIYRRAEHWMPDIVSGMGGVAEFRSLGLSVPLSEIYERVFSGPMPSDAGI